MKVWYAHVGEWVVSGNKGLTEEGVFVFFLSLYVCMSGVFDRGESSA